MRVENFDNLKWGMCTGHRRFPKVPYWSERGKIPHRAPRRVSIEIVYYDPGEYIDPLTGKPIDLVARFTQKIRLSSWQSWRPMQRLSVDRLVGIRRDESQLWSPRQSKKDNWKVKPIQQLSYGFCGRNRNFWYPVEWDIFFPDGGICSYTNRDLSTSPTLMSLEYATNTIRSRSDLTIPPTLNSSSQVVDFRPRPPQPRISYQF